METRKPESKRRTGQLAGVASMLAAVALLAAACSSPSPIRSVARLSGQGSHTQQGGTPSVTQSDQDFVNFARCMRGTRRADVGSVSHAGPSGAHHQPSPS